MTHYHFNFEKRWLQKVMHGDCPETKKKKMAYRGHYLRKLSDEALKKRIESGEQWLEKHWEDTDGDMIKKWDEALLAYEAMVDEARDRKLYKLGEK